MKSVSAVIAGTSTGIGRSAAMLRQCESLVKDGAARAWPKLRSGSMCEYGRYVK